MDKLTIYIDGCSKGNPGDAASAAVLYDENGEALHEAARYLGKATNNVAEYNALLLALEKAALFSVKEIQIFSDSQLLVRQYNGQYKIKNRALQALSIKVRKLVSNFDKVVITHITRDKNEEADALVNKAVKEKSDFDLYCKSS